MIVGENFTLGEYTLIRYKDSDTIKIGNHCRIADFCRISVKNVQLGDYIEIAPMVSIAGGGDEYKFIMDGYSSLAAGVKVWLSSNDYSNELVTHGLDKVREIEGDVIFEKFTGVGTNSVIMPNNWIPEGVVIGALSFVPSSFSFEPWTVYAGCPIRPIKQRIKEHVMRFHSELL